jgi:hypothetical protein
MLSNKFAQFSRKRVCSHFRRNVILTSGRGHTINIWMQGWENSQVLQHGMQLNRIVAEHPHSPVNQSPC